MDLQTFIILLGIGVMGLSWSFARGNPVAQRFVERMMVAVGFHPYLEETLASLEEIGMTKCHTCGVYARPGSKCCHNPNRRKV